MRLLELFENDGWHPTPYFHGSPVDWEGEPRVSKTGVYGRGFYLTNRREKAPNFGRFVHEFRVRGKLATARQLLDADKQAREEGFKTYAKATRATDILIDAGFSGIEDGPFTVIFSTDDLKPVGREITEEAELDMSDAARMERAKSMGFTITAFHGTAAKFNEFDVEKGKPSIMGGYAPHFSDSYGEAHGYASEAGRGAKVLRCLLRVKKPLVISFTPGTGKITPAEYKRITGVPWDGTDPKFPPNGRKALDKLMDTFGWHDHRGNWTNVYKVLASKGYDALFYADVASDHQSGKYGKYVVFNPKNVRLASAAFDPAKSDSADLRA